MVAGEVCVRPAEPPCGGLVHVHLHEPAQTGPSVTDLCSWTRPNVSKPARNQTVLNRPVLRNQTVLNRPEMMTGAHLGGRGAGRRRSCSATAAPREGARRRGHGDGRHRPRPQRSFFLPNSDRRVTFVPVTKIMLMDHGPAPPLLNRPTKSDRSKPAPAAARPHPPRRRQASRPW